MRRALVLLALAACQSPRPTPIAASPDGQQRAFDWELGTWKTQLRRLRAPLTGSTEWIEYEGTSVVREVWGGDANLLELAVDGSAGRIEGLSLRLYNPQTQQWSLHFANRRAGEMSPPTIGAFTGGRGEFWSDETLDGKPIRVRFVITQPAPSTAHFEQAFSADGGQTWEVNWIATDTRVE